VLTGVLIGIALSMVWLVYVSSVPQMPVMGKAPDEEVFRSTVAYPDSQTFPGLVALGIDGGLFFVDADALEDRVRELAQQGDQPLRVLVLDFEGVNYIDSQGSGTVANLVDLAQTHHVALRLARLKPYVFEVLSRDGVIDRMGRENVHDTVYGAAQDFIES